MTFLAQKLSLDALPRHSPWAARLLGAEPWAKRSKSKNEVLREYEAEKWGGLIRRVRDQAAPVRFTDVEAWADEGTVTEVVSAGDDLMLLSVQEARSRYLDIVAASLAKYFPAPALVELGAGYGSVLVRLAGRAPFCGGRIMGADLTASGQALLQHVAAAEQLPIEVGACDLAAAPITTLAVPPGAVIFTSFSACYLPRVEPAFFAAITSLQPAAVVHFEPVFEHYAPDSLLGLMRRRYVEVNDYNTNLWTALHHEAASGRIRLLEDTPLIFGQNALLPASVLAWAPR
jgi:hypothetical protein